MGTVMKRIIDGVTYNTDTSTKLARSEYKTQYNHATNPCVGLLYQTRGGAYFVHENIDLGRENAGDQNSFKDRFLALSIDEAQKWLVGGSEVEVFHNPFTDPPEAAAESEPSATIYMRVPVSLKKRLEEAANDEGLSGNSWAMRCMERCLNTNHRLRDDIGFAYWLADGLADLDLPVSEAQAAAAFRKIADTLKYKWKELGLADADHDSFDAQIMSLRDGGGYYDRQKDLLGEFEG
jgi:hypothetical protein